MTYFTPKCRSVSEALSCSRSDSMLYGSSSSLSRSLGDRRDGTRRDYSHDAYVIAIISCHIYGLFARWNPNSNSEIILKCSKLTTGWITQAITCNIKITRGEQGFKKFRNFADVIFEPHRTGCWHIGIQIQNLEWYEICWKLTAGRNTKAITCNIKIIILF